METLDKKVKDLIITRIFDASPELMFKAWTNPLDLKQWWGPDGFTNPVCELDVQTEGTILIDMRGPDDVIYPCTGKFHEIVEPDFLRTGKLVFTTNSFDNAQGISQLEVLNTAVFERDQDQTILTVHAEVIKATPEVSDSLNGMEEDWRQSFERLALHLEYMNRKSHL